MKQFLQQVAEFHRAFGQHQPEPIVPKLSNQDTNALRIGLMREELQELRQAIADNDRLEILDALCDIQYVLSGSVLAWGYGVMWDEATIMFRLVKIPDTDAHLAAMFGLLAQAEIACEQNYEHQVYCCLTGLQSRLQTAVYHFGFSPCFHEAFATVHSNNLGKLWREEEVTEYLYSENLGGEQLAFTQFGDKMVAKNSSGKVIKSPGFTKVSLERFV
jgi:hypothetical protein